VGRAALRRRRVEEMFALFPALADKAGERAWRLSGGQQQMLAIARALANRPPVLLLDEPSLGLAPIIAREVFGRLRTIADDGVAVLLAEQNATRALAIADEAVVLAQGGVAHRGPAAGLAPEMVADLLVAG
jgi:branched-chain amino acid transport system ATP-binding protein